MKKPLYLLFFLLLHTFAFAQQDNYRVSGTVVDSLSGKGVELSTIILKQWGSDKMLTGATADSLGNFTLASVPTGKYDLSVSFIGYNSTTQVLEVRSDMQLGIIRLPSSSKALGEAVVTATKSLIVKTSEKTVFNVAESPNNQTGTAEDVLRNMPGVMVDREGNVSIIGKQGVKVLVDGRPNALAQSNLQAFLKSIPANAIEAIELITNPSAKYDAEGNAGIINIKLKKGKADGLNGNISAGYGFFNRYNGNAAINYRKNKINFFAVYGINASREPNRYIETRTLLVNDTTSYYNLDSKGIENHINNNLKTGLDYFINDKNTLTYTIGGNYNIGKWATKATSWNYDSDRNLVNSFYTVNDEPNSNLSITNDVAYKKTFDTTERELDVDVSYTYLNGLGHAPFNSVAYDSLGVEDATHDLIRRTQSNNWIQNIIAQVDYIHPIKKLKGYKIETGLKNETTLSNNQFDAYQTVNNVEWKDTLLSNRFSYTENIGALYFILDGAHKWFSYSAGLRAEHTYIKSNSSSVNKNYFSFFPSATVNAQINDAQTFSISYSRRVQRPQFRQINNSVTYIDQYSTWQGNPNLQPSFSHLLSLNYSAMVKQHTFSLSADGYIQTADFIESSIVDSNRIARGGVLNGADKKGISLSFYAKLQLTKWWDVQMNHSYQYTYYSYKADINAAPIKGGQYNLWLSTSFTFWKNMVLNINGWVNTKGVQPQGIMYPVGMLNASIKKSFFKDRFTVSVAGQNLLNTMKWHWTVNAVNMQTEGSWQSFSRFVMVTLSYRFGTGKVTQRKTNTDERLSGGGQGR